jgi:hypothetical protein
MDSHYAAGFGSSSRIQWKKFRPRLLRVANPLGEFAASGNQLSLANRRFRVWQHRKEVEPVFRKRIASDFSLENVGRSFPKAGGVFTIGNPLRTAKAVCIFGA